MRGPRVCCFLLLHPTIIWNWIFNYGILSEKTIDSIQFCNTRRHPPRAAIFEPAAQAASSCITSSYRPPFTSFLIGFLFLLVSFLLSSETYWLLPGFYLRHLVWFHNVLPQRFKKKVVELKWFRYAFITFFENDLSKVFSASYVDDKGQQVDIGWERLPEQAWWVDREDTISKPQKENQQIITRGKGKQFLLFILV